MPVFSPDASQHEVAGMRVGLAYAAKRANLTGAELRCTANLLWQYFAVERGKADFANGLRDGMYIASQQRA